MMEKNAKIYVAGHRGMVGSAIVRELERQGYTNIITRTHKELDLCRQDAVEEFFAAEKPEYVFLAAAKVGGIVANQNALADFMYDNMTLEMNVIHSAWKNGCKKLEFLGSSCIYPRMAPQPMKENCLLTSELEKTNEAYALAKISGLKYCEFLNRQYGTDYISVMPTNLYGPNDNYHPTHSHVVPALIRRFHEAKGNGVTSVTCWGDGSPLREFLYVDDLANLCVFLMNNYSGNETVNAGTGKELTIKELTELVAKVVGYTGEIKWDPTNPNNKYEGTAEQWDHAQSVMERILKDLDVDYTVGIDEAAFYGPKLDIQYKNVYGKEDTLVTIQIDMLLAERFGMYYIDENGNKVLPYIIHRTSLGCYERTLAYLIEEYAGALPTWMMPEQVRFLPITDRAADYCAQQAAELRKQGFRVEVDSRNEKVGKKIREAKLAKKPYMLVVGDRDIEACTVSVRTRAGEDLGAMSLADFSRLLRDVVDSKARK